MRVETFGLPGAGKTTISTAVQGLLKDQGHIALNARELDELDAAHPPGFKRIWQEDKDRQTFHIARYLQKHGAFHSFCTKLYSDNTRNLGLLLSVGADLSRYRLRAGQLNSFWVDEGFLHLGVHALLEASGWNRVRAQDDIARYLDLLPRPDAIMMVNASVETATKGIFARIPGRSAERSTRRFENAFGGTEGMIERARIITMVAERMHSEGVPILEAERAGDLGETARAIALKVNELANIC